MKQWVLKLIKHKIRVTPVVVKNQLGGDVRVTWKARQLGSGLEFQANDPTMAVNGLVDKIAGNDLDDLSVA
jgi:hypothetical protein